MVADRIEAGTFLCAVAATGGNALLRNGRADHLGAVIDKLKDILKSIDCNVSEVENLGQKEFSRVVDRKFPSGLYVQFHFEGPVSAPTTFREKLRLDRTVNRLLVQVTK